MHTIAVNSIETLQALCDKTRLRILRLLVSNPSEEACPCEFSDSLQEPEYNISRHLKILRKAGLLIATKDGRWIYHRLVNEPLIQPFYELVLRLSDDGNVYKDDARRFRTEIKKRATARCVKDGPEFSRSDKSKASR